MVANHHGLNTDLQALRRRFSVSLKGTSLSRLVDIAQVLGFQARALRLEMEDLGQLQTPCILHWNLDHFVVLVKVGRRHATILDPALGKRRLALGEIAEHFTGVALELAPSASFTRQLAPPAVKLSQLTGPIQGLWSALTQIVLFSLALQVFVLLAPFFMQWIVDQALVTADQDLLTVLGLGFGLAMLLQVLIGLLRGWALVFLSSRMGLQWMGNVFAHAIRLPLDYFEKRHLGDVVSRMSSVHAIQRTLTNTSVEALIDGLLAVCTLVMMVLYSLKLAVITFIAIASYLCVRLLVFSQLRAATEKEMVAAARQQSHVLESLRGVQSVKVAGQESHRQNGFQNLLVDTVNRQLVVSKLNLAFSAANQTIFGIERIAVIWIGAMLAMQSVFSVGMLIAYLTYKEQFAQRVAGLIDKWIEFRMLRLHGERLADVVLTPQEHDASTEVEQNEPETMRIEVQGLSFRYAEDEPWVLRNCSFTVEAGESVAIVGASGCGKSSLVKLMLGLLTPTEGRILIGGRDIRHFGMRNYRKLIGAVLQDDQLFAGSLAENIAFGELVDFERIEVAARRAAIHDEISAMPMGYHSLVGDMGGVLSGGQKQRVILARALYRDPKLLFLDEATSSLDIERERLVNKSVRLLKPTTIIIAHRPETVASADRVLLMRGGSLAQDVRRKEIPHAADAHAWLSQDCIA